MVVLLWALTLLLLLGYVWTKKEQPSPSDDEHHNGENAKNEETTDYQIYEMIDTMQALSKHQTFYDLLEITPSATSEEIARRFRFVSRYWHPDKNNSEEARKMYTLMTSVSALLRSDTGRKRYEWILHEAPAWHRSSYLVRKFVQTSRLSVPQVLLLCLGFGLLVQLLVQWTGYFSAVYLIWSGRKAVGDMGQKEKKRLRKRLADGDPTFLAWSNTSYQNLLDAERETPRAPRLTELFIFRLPIILYHHLMKSKATADAPERKTE